MVTMELRKATYDDWPLLLGWRNDPETRKNSHTMLFISEQDHKEWLKKNLKDKSKHFYIGVVDKFPVGIVRAETDNQTDIIVLSWTIAPGNRGKGVGKELVKAFADMMPTRIRAEIKKGNIPSCKIAEYAGMTFKYEENGVLHYSNYE